MTTATHWQASDVDVTSPPFNLDDAQSAWVEQTLRSLTLEQRVGQLLCVYMKADDVGSWWEQMRRDGIEPGGVLLLPRGADKARADIADIQSRSTVPLLVSANLESGAVNFVAGTEAFANPMQIAATGDPEDARSLARHCARVAGSIGINWAFAPVVDIAMNPANPITNTRTFGDAPPLVAAAGAAYVKDLEARAIATSPKHFPGDGVDGRDQHLVTTNNDLSTADWWETFGAVYREIIAAGARTIMVGHIRQPALTRERRPGVTPREIMPASLAPELLHGVLRDDLDFNGLIVSDNTAMTGFTSVLPRTHALPATLNAGVDMILGNLSVTGDFQILVAAAREGRIDPGRLEDAVRRILATKASLGLHEPVPSRNAVEGSELDDAHRRDDIARRSITLVKDTQDLLPITPSTHRRCLVIVLGDEATFYDPSGPFAPHFVDGLRRRGLTVEVWTVPTTGVDAAAAEKLHERFDVCIYFANVRFAGNSNVLRVRWTPWQGPDTPRHVATLPTALVSIADPYLLQDMPMIRTAINGYTPTTSTVDAALEVLFGDIEAVGHSPVDPFAGCWDAAL